MNGDEVMWVVRQTGHGQRSWHYDASKVHAIGDEAWITRCGVAVPMGMRFVTPNPRDERCKRCFPRSA